MLKKYQTPIPPVPKKVWQDPLYFFAFGFGSGTFPYAPGTVGTLMSVPFFLFMQPLSVPFYFLCVMLFIAASIFACEKVSREIQVQDHQGMCIDEFAGFFVTMINAPQGLSWLVVGFLLFRFFDIVKPWPIRLMDEKIHGGFGMVLDDVMAGFYSFLIIQLLAYFIR